MENLPCGDCKYCTGVQEKWAAFHEEVDDRVNLAQTLWDMTKRPWDPGGFQGGEETDPTVVVLVKAQEV